MTTVPHSSILETICFHPIKQVAQNEEDIVLTIIKHVREIRCWDIHPTEDEPKVTLYVLTSRTVTVLSHEDMLGCLTTEAKIIVRDVGSNDGTTSRPFMDPDKVIPTHFMEITTTC